MSATVLEMFEKIKIFQASGIGGKPAVNRYDIFVSVATHVACIKARARPKKL